MLYANMKPDYIITDGNENTIEITFQNMTEKEMVWKNDGVMDKPPAVDSGEDDTHMSRVYLWFHVLDGEKPPEEEKKYFCRLKEAEEIQCTVREGFRNEVYKGTDPAYYWAVYPETDTTLLPGERIEIMLSGVKTSLPPERISGLTIQYNNDSVRQYIPIALQSPLLRIFDIQTEGSGQAGIGDKVTVSWTAQGAEKYTLTPGDLLVSGRGEQDYYIWRDTAFCLYADQGGDTESKSCMVRAVPGQILSFQATPAELSWGEQTTLQFSLKDCNHAWIDQGIGLVEGISALKVTPQKAFNRYTIYCEGENGYTSKSCDVIVKDFLELQYFSVNPAAEGKYTLRWGTINADTVKILCKSKLLSQKMTGFLENIILEEPQVTVLCTGAKGQKIEKTFHV